MCFSISKIFHRHDWVVIEDVKFDIHEHLEKRDIHYIDFYRFMSREYLRDMDLFWDKNDWRICSKIIQPQVCVKCGKCKNDIKFLEIQANKYINKYLFWIADQEDRQDLANKIYKECKS